MAPPSDVPLLEETHRRKDSRGPGRPPMQVAWAVAAMRLCLYNLLAAQTIERAEELSIELRSCFAILVPGTCRRSLPDFPVERRGLTNHVEYSWGWRDPIPASGRSEHLLGQAHGTTAVHHSNKQTIY